MPDSRTDERGDLPDPIRIRLLEKDADIGEIRYSELIDKIDKLSGRNIGIMISLATAALLLAADIIVRGLGHG